MAYTTLNISAPSGLMQIVYLRNSSEIAITMILIFLLLGIAIKNAKYTYIQHVKDLLGSTKYSQKFNISKETSLNQSIIWILALLGFSFFFVISFIFFDHKNTIFQSEFVLNFFIKTAITFAAVSFVLLLQQQFLKFVTWLFSFDKNSFELILYSYFLVVKLLGITLLIVSFFFLYLPISWQPTILYFGFVIVFFVFLFLAIYYIRNFFNKFVSLCYFFLYLCTLKILPILVLRKLLIEAYKMV